MWRVVSCFPPRRMIQPTILPSCSATNSTELSAPAWLRIHDRSSSTPMVNFSGWVMRKPSASSMAAIAPRPVPGVAASQAATVLVRRSNQTGVCPLRHTRRDLRCSWLEVPWPKHGRGTDVGCRHALGDDPQCLGFHGLFTAGQTLSPVAPLKSGALWAGRGDRYGATRTVPDCGPVVASLLWSGSARP